MSGTLTSPLLNDSQFFALMTTFQDQGRGRMHLFPGEGGLRLLSCAGFRLTSFGPSLFSLQFSYWSVSVSSLTAGVKDQQTGSASVDRSWLWASNYLWQTRRPDRQYWSTDPSRQVAVFVMSDLFSRRFQQAYKLEYWFPVDRLIGWPVSHLLVLDCALNAHVFLVL